jgi:flagellar basal-body rod protein FlgF
MRVVEKKSNIPIQKPNAIMLSMQELQWLKLNTTANNLTNASTPGFKSQTIRSEEVQYKNKENQTVSFVKSGGTVRDLTDGAIKSTGNPLDVAISGNGYFVVSTASGFRYTRNGQFIVNEQGFLTTASDQIVLNKSKSAISIPYGIDKINIAQDGTLSAHGASFDALAVVTFSDENSLIPEGSTLYHTDQDSVPVSASRFKLTQGALEESNVSPVQESIRLMEIMRMFENAQQVINEYEQLQRKTINASSRNV